MKVAILSESPADEAAIQIVLRGLLAVEIEIIPRRARPGGWKAALEAVPPALKELHYRRTASALVVVIDSDNSAIHRDEHEQPGREDVNCRFCQVQRMIREVRQSLSPQPSQPPVDTAVAVAVPAIEAWYLCGREADCTEADWDMRQRGGARSRSEIASLKRIVYGTDRPSLDLETSKAKDCASRLVQDIAVLQRFFPVSFGRFAAEVRSWLPR
jgi:hypothetical protein